MYELIGRLLEGGNVICYIGRDPSGKPVRLSLDNIILLTSAKKIARAVDINEAGLGGTAKEKVLNTERP